MARNTAMMTIVGDKDLRRKLDRIGQKILGRVVRPAVNKAMTPISKDAKRRAKSIGDNNTISKSIGKRPKTYRGAGVTILVVGPRRGHKNPESGHNPSNTAHLVEYGTAPHKITPKRGRVLAFDSESGGDSGVDVVVPSVNHPGTKARPFMRPAFDSKRHLALSILFREIRLNIVKEAKKA